MERRAPSPSLSLVIVVLWGGVGEADTQPFSTITTVFVCTSNPVELQYSSTSYT